MSEVQTNPEAQRQKGNRKTTGHAGPNWETIRKDAITAWETLKTAGKQTRDGWVAIGRCLLEVEEEAHRRAKSKTKTPAFKTERNKLLASLPFLKNLSDVQVSRCKRLAREWDEIGPWLNKEPEKRMELVGPSSILEHYDDAHPRRQGTGKSPRLRPVQQFKQDAAKAKSAQKKAEREAAQATAKAEAANAQVEQLRQANNAIQESAVVLRFPDRAEPTTEELARTTIEKMGSERAEALAREILRQLGAAA